MHKFLRAMTALVCGAFMWLLPTAAQQDSTLAKPEDRAAWLSDVRTALEKHGIRWAMWDYSGGFGVVTRTQGQPVVDAVTVKALGLQMPPSAPH